MTGGLRCGRCCRVCDAHPRLKRACCRASQVPGQARRRIIKVDHTIYTVLRHGFDNDVAEPALLRLRHGRSIVLGPAHGEGISVDAPGDIHRPLSVESAPYFPALVESSWSASPIACAEAGLRRSWGPHMAIRGPMRSAKCASWAQTRSLSSTPFHSLRTSRSWLAESAWMRSEKRSMKSSGFLAAVW